MKFCPKCETRFRTKPDETMVVCPKCGFKAKKEATVSRGVAENKKGSNSSLKVMDGENDKESLPTINIDCPKCGNDTAVWWMLQTRSADEPTTQFFRCIKCSHTWRNYS